MSIKLHKLSIFNDLGFFNQKCITSISNQLFVNKDFYV